MNNGQAVAAGVVVVTTAATLYVIGDLDAVLRSRHRRGRFSLTTLIRIAAGWELSIGLFLIVSGQYSMAMGPILLAPMMVGTEALLRRLAA